MEASPFCASRPIRFTAPWRGIIVLLVATLLVPLAAYLSPTEYVDGRQAGSGNSDSPQFVK
jgi:hypothetical protein